MFANVAFFIAFASIYAVLAIGLNLQWGYGGMFNAGIAGFWAIGAYTAAFLTTPPSPPDQFGYPGHLGGFGYLFPRFGIFSTSTLVGIVVAMAVTALFGFLIAVPTLRLREDYLAIATLGLAQIITTSIQNLQSVTAGVFGIGAIPRPITFPGQFALTEIAFAVFAAAALVLVYLATERMSRSPWGRVMRAVREDEDAAMVLGKNSFALKMQSFVIGCALMGLAGALFAYFQGVISTVGEFTPTDTFFIWTIVFVGGSGNHKGAIIGAFVFYFLFWFSTGAKDWFGVPSNLATLVIYVTYVAIGFILIVLVLARPRGILPEPQKVSRRPRIVLGGSGPR